uniref:AH domain-containing protein n=1 Tax=Acrobeloides nanus TaxID=290746 RepID=A0A914C0G2_9BILA
MFADSTIWGKMMTESRNIFIPGKEEPTTPTDSVAGPTPRSPTATNILGTNNVCANTNLAQMSAKIDELKTWTVSKYKTTKQNVLEQLGKVERTHDKEIEDKIESLHDMHRRYNELLSSARAFTNYFALQTNMQKTMAEAFYQLSLKEDSLKTELNSQCDSMRNICHNGEMLHKALTYMISSLETLCEKTIADTLITVHNHDQARLEYDVYRQELVTLKQNMNTANTAISEAEEKCNQQRGKYEQLKEDVRVKITLLDENRLKVMRKQMSLFHSALSAYYSGNVKALQSTVEQFSLEDDQQDGTIQAFMKNGPSAPSFLEQ